MTIEEVKKYFGTWTAMIKALDCGVSIYQYWRKIGYIPYNSQLLIEKKTNGALVASEEDAKPKNKE